MKQAVLDCVWPRQEEVKQSLLQNTAVISSAYLKDFDWKVKVSSTVLNPTCGILHLMAGF